MSTHAPRHARSLMDAFETLPEYRKNLLNVAHKLSDIVAIAVMAVTAGADGPTDIFCGRRCTRKS